MPTKRSQNIPGKAPRPSRNSHNRSAGVRGGSTRGAHSARKAAPQGFSTSAPRSRSAFEPSAKTKGKGGFSNASTHGFGPAFSQVASGVSAKKSGPEVLLTRRNLLIGAGAIAGVTVSELAALLYMAWDYLRTRRHAPSPLPSERPDSAKHILKTCLLLAIPITITAASTSVMTAVDNALVLGRLQNAGLLLSEDAARSLMGNYTGVQTVYQIPAALMVAITASVIPAVTICFTQKDRTGAAKIVGSSLKTAALLAFPSGIGMLVLGKPIVQLLFPGLDADIAGTILSILGIANIFVCLMLVATSVLQAYNILSLPIFTMLAGGVVMVLFDYFMVGTVRFNIYGSPVGTCLCFGLTCALDLHLVRRAVPGCPGYGCCRLGGVWADQPHHRGQAGGHRGYFAGGCAVCDPAGAAPGADQG